ERRAAAPLADRLRRLAPGEEIAHLRFIHAGLVLEGELRREEPLVRDRRVDVAIARLVLARLARVRPAVTIDRFDLEHVIPRLAAECTGVHRERATHRAGNAGEELGGAKAPLDALSGDARAGDTGFGEHRGLALAFETIERAVRGDDDPVESAVAH